MNYILLLIGFVLLIKGADIFVDGAAATSKKLGIPAVIVGLTIVSLGTSAPELAVSTISSIQGSNELALGNVLGSNIFNTLVVLGASTIIMPLIIKKKAIKKDFIINIAVVGLLFFLTFDGIIFGTSNEIGRIDGIILLTVCIVYTICLINQARKNSTIQNESEEEKQERNEIKIGSNVVKILIGVAGIVIGGNVVVTSATDIAVALGMSQKLVGLTIVAIGTSLPELVTSAVAAFKGEEDIALGNILGSNIFNILLILGVASCITPIAVQSALVVDFLFLIVATLVIAAIIYMSKGEEKKLSKFDGFLFVAMYIGYMVFIIVRG
ncbi:MAG: calcium/sodium antiporter [Clostridium sp.]